MFKRLINLFIFALLLTVFLLGNACAKDIVRPERICSKRQVVYDRDTYEKLKNLWKDYYDEFPSEDAYANWMYAARYAGDPDFLKLLKKGLKKYPANPTLLYLQANSQHGKRDNHEAQEMLIRATQLDPEYMDPWFLLVGNYMSMYDDEQTDYALRKLLEGAAIAEEVMDYNYNMLTTLEENAILITNGDNDTYPGWVLTRILDYRSDVTIVNRSLLNTDWYPQYLIKRGLVGFITPAKLEELRKTVRPPWGDSLIVRIIEAAEKANRPVYFASTLGYSEIYGRYFENGKAMGLAILVSKPLKSYADYLRDVVPAWLENYRTGGLDSWRLHHARVSDAGKMLVSNYARLMVEMIDEVEKSMPQYRLPLFRWYRDHLAKLIPEMYADQVNRVWSRFGEIGEIRQWCESKGYIE